MICKITLDHLASDLFLVDGTFDADTEPGAKAGAVKAWCDQRGEPDARQSPWSWDPTLIAPAITIEFFTGGRDCGKANHSPPPPRPLLTKTIPRMTLAPPQQTSTVSSRQQHLHPQK